MRIKHLPDLSVGDWTIQAQSHNPTYSIDCNLGVRGKTAVGDINYRAHDEELIGDDLINEASLGGDREYVFESETMHPL